MFVADLFEDSSNLVVVYPGRFQPFHKGHKAVYDGLVKKFGRDRVFIATSNKVDPPRSPFNFSDKSVFMALTGVPMDRVIESREPYKVPELTALYPAESTTLIFAVSEKDMAEDPRFRMGTKKDGSPTYFQPLPSDLKNTNTLDKTGYILTVPTVDFTVLGAPMRSATEVRQQYKDADPATRKQIITDLFGRYSEEAQHIMDQKLVITEDLKKSLGSLAAAACIAGTPGCATTDGVTARDALIALRTAKNVQNINKDSVRAEIDQEIRAIARGDRNASKILGQRKRSNEDAAGVGVVASNKKMARDPRYSMSMTRDIGPGTLNKMLRAFRLVETLYSIDKTAPMVDSEVLIPGYGRLTLQTLHKKLEKNFHELGDMLATMDPDAVRRAQYIIAKSPLPVMLDSLLQAYRDLSAQRRKGGTSSRGIPKGMFADE